ncbi:MAG: hypothetical protein ACW98D_12390 [Promethearchaeota archaeon]|jgi:hypothetical protein
MYEMEDIKNLYKKLEYSSEEEREKIWEKIIKRNKALFNQKSKELHKILKKI